MRVILRALRLSADTVRSAPQRALLMLAGFAIGVAALTAVSLLSDSLADLNRRQLESSGFANIKVRPMQTYWLDGIYFPHPDPAPALDAEFIEQLAESLSPRATVYIVDSTAIPLQIGSTTRGVAVVSRVPVGESASRSSLDIGSAVVSSRLSSLLRRERGQDAADSIALPTRVLSITGTADDSYGFAQLAVYVNPDFLTEIGTAAERYLLLVPHHPAIDENYKEILRSTQRQVQENPQLRDRVDISASGPQQLGRITTAMTVFRVSFSTIALLCIAVAGLGAANVVLLATIQRAREVGIRRSVGATSSDIKLQFALESIILAISGGLLGLLAGWMIVRLAAHILATRTSIELYVSFNLFSALIPLLTAVGVGLVAAVVPASKAAKIDPATALRDE